jgi:Fe2+ transport system protein B
MPSRRRTPRRSPGWACTGGRFRRDAAGGAGRLPDQLRGANARLRGGSRAGTRCRDLQRLGPDDTERLIARVEALEKRINRGAADALIEERYRAIATLLQGALVQGEASSRDHTAWLDAVLLHRWAAFPLFLGIMYLMFTFTINVGGAFIDFFDISRIRALRRIAEDTDARCGTARVAGGRARRWRRRRHAAGSEFRAVIASLFLFQSFLEDSGYMARRVHPRPAHARCRAPGRHDH